MTVTFAPFTTPPTGSVTVPERSAVFTCDSAIVAQPSINKHSIIIETTDRQAVETHTTCLRRMSPPNMAPVDLPLPLAVAGLPAPRQLMQLNTRLLLQCSAAFNRKLPSRSLTVKNPLVTVTAALQRNTQNPTRPSKSTAESLTLGRSTRDKVRNGGRKDRCRYLSSCEE